MTSRVQGSLQREAGMVGRGGWGGPQEGHSFPRQEAPYQSEQDFLNEAAPPLLEVGTIAGWSKSTTEIVTW